MPRCDDSTHALSLFPARRVPVCLHRAWVRSLDSHFLRAGPAFCGRNDVYSCCDPAHETCCGPSEPDVCCPNANSMCVDCNNQSPYACAPGQFESASGCCLTSNPVLGMCSGHGTCLGNGFSPGVSCDCDAGYHPPDCACTPSDGADCCLGYFGTCLKTVNTNDVLTCPCYTVLIQCLAAMQVLCSLCPLSNPACLRTYARWIFLHPLYCCMKTMCGFHLGMR